MDRREPHRHLLVAAAGWGKTTSARALLARGGVVAPASSLVDRVDGSQRVDLLTARALLVEDLHEVAPQQRTHLLRRLDERGAAQLVLTSREPLTDAERAELRGPLRQRGPRHLALGSADVTRILEEEYDVRDPAVVTLVHHLTGGWPMLVHLAGDDLAGRPVETLAEAADLVSAAVAPWARPHLLASCPAAALDLLVRIAGLEPLSEALVSHLHPGAPDRARAAYRWLVGVGLVRPLPALELLGRDGTAVVPVVARALAGDTEAGPDVGLLAEAAQWFEEHDQPFPALRCHLRRGRHDLARVLVEAAGPQMIRAGHARDLVTIPAVLDWAEQSPGVCRTLAEARHLTGDSPGATRAFAPLVTTADSDGWDAGLAHRVAALRYTQGDLHGALAALARARRRDQESAAPEVVRLIACHATVLSMLGDDDAARQQSLEALELAERCGDLGALVAAHQAVAKTSQGSRKEAHLARALSAATAAGDVVSVARVLGNQSFVLLASGRFAQAVGVCRRALRAAEVARPTGALTAALHNLAEALLRTGEPREACWHLHRSVAISRTLGPHRAASGLCGLGAAHRSLGRHQQARAAYQEAVTMARASEELQVLVPALAGLARTLVDGPADETLPDAAREAATEALHRAPTSIAPLALTALGWVARSEGDRNEAAALARASEAAARELGDLDLLAESLELVAATSEEPDETREALLEARAVWHDGGAWPETCRIDVLLARGEPADAVRRSVGRVAARRLRDLGIDRVQGVRVDHPGSGVLVQVLGGFSVHVDGGPVPLTAWRSRQARTLVKILAARRGRPLSRSALCELLWPDDDPAKTPHRLSVLLTTVRSVLDPAKARAAEHVVASDKTGVWLDLRQVRLDAEELIDDAAAAARLLGDGDVERAREILTDVIRRHPGEALEDEADEAWAMTLREETRLAWLQTLRHAATLATREGRLSDCCATLARLLSVDPFDEQVHRGLVTSLLRAGRHGEAQRAFAIWDAAMRDIDAPRPDPALVAGARTHRAPPAGVLIPR